MRLFMFEHAKHMFELNNYNFKSKTFANDKYFMKKSI